MSSLHPPETEDQTYEQGDERDLSAEAEEDSTMDSKVALRKPLMSLPS